MSYPTTIDSFTNPTANQKLNSPSHSGIETAQNTALSALETKMGVDSSAVTTTIDYLLKSTSSLDPGHKHSFSSLYDFSVTSPAVGQFLVYNGTKFANQVPIVKFGGTGADGALAIISGTTTIDCANAATVIKNYTSISITGTALLTFINPNANGTTVTLKSQGAVTLTSSATPMINMSAMGAAGGAGVTQSGVGQTSGNNGSPGYCFGVFSITNFGALGTGSSTTATPGAGGAAPTATYPANVNTIQGDKYPFAFVGAGSGSGGVRVTSSGGGTSGAGGRGGGCLIIECGGALNFTTTNGISVAGQNGQAYSGNTGNVQIAGAPGGPGGYCSILYNTLTSASGTVTISGGTGQTGLFQGSNSGDVATGGTGASYLAGTVGVDSTGKAPDGVSGLSLVALNTEFA